MKYNSYVLHVKKGYEEREKSIIEQFSSLELPFEWILDHDKDDITSEILKAYQYKGNFNVEAISCALKHICAWERIAQEDCDGGFVFEDDVLIDLERFKQVSKKALAEYQALWPGCGYISLGSGCALYVPWTKKRKNRMLYQASYARAADSYWINRETAQIMVKWVKENGFAKPADHLIDHICSELNIPILWLEPTIADQGSHTGLFTSSIQILERGTFIDRVGWKMKIMRRKYLYPLIGKDLRKND